MRRINLVSALLSGASYDEPKWDAIRAVLVLDAGLVTIWSRQGKDLTRLFLILPLPLQRRSRQGALSTVKPSFGTGTEWTSLREVPVTGVEGLFQFADLQIGVLVGQADAGVSKACEQLHDRYRNSWANSDRRLAFLLRRSCAGLRRLRHSNVLGPVNGCENIDGVKAFIRCRLRS